MRRLAFGPHEKALHHLGLSGAGFTTDNYLGLDHQGMLQFAGRPWHHSLITTRARHFTTAMEFARGHHDGSADDDLPNETFDRFRFNLGPTTLRPDGLLAAACLARPGQQAAEVSAGALEVLQSHDGDRETLVRALFQLQRQDVHLEPAPPAIHSDHLIRLLAAGLWCETEEADPVTGRVLAEDRNAMVRQYMAMHADKAHLQELL
ncbi:hypothetical protein OG863_40550 [Streptomyces decoyicus]|uniref:Uncharacterized protein n=1 Tax=Streptomyces decoyicus TaxID=249567 RepID=A0ABZ1FTB1_9ACTN|nr:hypothetical protein [Streptomyces decoyicus]WSB73722.1 hypothetical protein OG863_40550 [Streptomyces decoyicus]